MLDEERRESPCRPRSFCSPAPDVALALVVPCGNEKVVDDNAGAGPIESWGNPMAIRVVIAEIEWKKT